MARQPPEEFLRRHRRKGLLGLLFLFLSERKNRAVLLVAAFGLAGFFLSITPFLPEIFEPYLERPSLPGGLLFDAREDLSRKPAPPPAERRRTGIGYVLTPRGIPFGWEGRPEREVFRFVTPGGLGAPSPYSLARTPTVGWPLPPSVAPAGPALPGPQPPRELQPLKPEGLTFPLEKGIETYRIEPEGHEGPEPLLGQDWVSGFLAKAAAPLEAEWREYGPLYGELPQGLREGWPKYGLNPGSRTNLLCTWSTDSMLAALMPRSLLPYLLNQLPPSPWMEVWPREPFHTFYGTEGPMVPYQALAKNHCLLESYRELMLARVGSLFTYAKPHFPHRILDNRFLYTGERLTQSELGFQRFELAVPVP